MTASIRPFISTTRVSHRSPYKKQAIFDCRNMTYRGKSAKAVSISLISVHRPFPFLSAGAGNFYFAHQIHLQGTAPGRPFSPLMYKGRRGCRPLQIIFYRNKTEPVRLDRLCLSPHQSATLTASPQGEASSYSISAKKS